MTPGARLSRAAGLVVLSMLLMGAIYAVPYLPTNDGPEWVYLAHVQNHMGDPHTPYAAEYTPALQFASRGFVTVYRPVEAWLGWERGLQLALGLVVLGAAWGFVALVDACDPRRGALGFLGFPLALSWHLYMGFWAFVVGSALGLFILALAVRVPQPSWRMRGALSLLLLVQAVSHVFSAVLTGGVLLCLVLARASAGRRLRELGAIVLVGLPASAVLAASFVVSQGQAALMLTRTGTEWLPLGRALAILPQTIAPGPFVRALALLVGLAGATLLAAWRARQGSTDPRDRGLAVAGLVLLLLGTLAPLEVPGWSFFSQRFLPAGMALVIAVIPLERLVGMRQRVVAMALFVASAGYLAVSFPWHQRLAGCVTDALAGLAAPVHRTTRQLPVPLAVAERSLDVAADVPMLRPLLHMGALYAVAFGGVVPSVFTVNSSVHPLLRQPHPGEPDWVGTPERFWGAVASPRFAGDVAYRHAVEDALASLGIYYQGVVLLGAEPDDVALWSRRGYVLDESVGETFVGHFKPCHLDVAVHDAATDATPSLDVRVGSYQLVTDARTAPRMGTDGVTHFEIAAAPCGDVTVIARSTKDSNAPFCRNADEAGALHATLTRSSGEVLCDGPLAQPPPTR